MITKISENRNICNDLEGEHCFWQGKDGILEATGSLEEYSPGMLLRNGWLKYYIPKGSLLCCYQYRGGIGWLKLEI